MVSPDSSAVVYVLDQSEVWVQPLGDAAPRRLDDGTNDFCFDPVVRPDSTVVCWQGWSVPNMAWDNARLRCAPLCGGTVKSIGGDGAAQQPSYVPDGRLLSVRDGSGWNNVWLGETVLVDEPFEHAGPTWGLGQRSVVASPHGTHVAFTRNEDGFGRLCVVELGTGDIREVARGVHGQLSWGGNRLAALRTGACTPTQVVVYDTETWARSIIDVGPLSGWENEPLVEPECHQIIARDGAVLHARLYRADNPTDRLVCWLHGGPTDQWQVTFMPRVAYWRSRGWNVLVPDHRGSTGHGRSYQQALHGEWGVLDVNDVCDVLEDAYRQRWGTSQRTVLMGGSAGGFTVLGVLANAPGIVAAAVVSYPVTDLFDLAERSHRFEQHYTLSLIGPVPQNRDAPGPYRDRSPVNLAERIRTPLLMFHGEDDAVVPVEQSRVFAAKVAMHGGVVELCVYAGEGHGFRQPVNQLDEYRRVGDFITEHVG